MNPWMPQPWSLLGSQHALGQKLGHKQTKFPKNKFSARPPEDQRHWLSPEASLRSGRGGKRNWGSCKHPADPEAGGAESQVWCSAVVPMENDMEKSWIKWHTGMFLSP